jgi:hypothetical protein
MFVPNPNEGCRAYRLANFVWQGSKMTIMKRFVIVIAIAIALRVPCLLNLPSRPQSDRRLIRYSEFDDFRNKLVKTFPHAKAAMPPLPPKSVVCMDAHIDVHMRVLRHTDKVQQNFDQIF